MKSRRLALLLFLSCASAQGWADALSDCRQTQDRDRQLKGCTQYIEENAAAPTRMLVAAYLWRSSAHLHKGDAASAIADFTKIIELDADNAPAHGLRGLTYFNKGAYQDAIADYTKAIALLHPKLDSRLLASHHMVRGLAREKTGERELAIADLRRSLEIAPDSPNLRGAKSGLKRLGASP